MNKKEATLDDYLTIPLYHEREFWPNSFSLRELASFALSLWVFIHVFHGRFEGWKICRSLPSFLPSFLTSSTRGQSLFLLDYSFCFTVPTFSSIKHLADERRLPYFTLSYLPPFASLLLTSPHLTSLLSELAILRPHHSQHSP